MQELRLADGKFMCGSEIVPPIIGDPEQIALIQKAEKELQRREKEGIPCEFYAQNANFDGYVDFKCLCGMPINAFISMRESRVYDLESDISDRWTGEEIECDECGREYVIRGGKAKLKLTEKE